MILAGGSFRHGQHFAFNRPYLDELHRELSAPPGTEVNTPHKVPMMGKDKGSCD